MAFPRNLLNDTEDLVLDLRPHWLYIVPSGLALGAGVIVSIWALMIWSPDDTLGSIVRIVCGVAVIGLLGWFGWTYAEWNTTNFVLTTDRIVTRRGVLSKQGVEIPLERVNTVFFSQSVFERMVGAGDLGIE